MLRYIYKYLLNNKQKLKIKQKYYKNKKYIADRFFKYTQKELTEVFLKLGIKPGDTLFMHSSLNKFHGFQGIPQDIINCLIEILGENGNLLMVSMPYRCSSYDYLKKNEVFNVKKTPSRMGIISEIFRRKKEVFRSIHPTHPVLAYGKDAPWIVDGHENCLYPCGKNTPFDKFNSLQGKILFFDVPFNMFTFIHYIEDMLKDQLPFQLYTEQPLISKIINDLGNEITINTYVYSDIAVKGRNAIILKKYLIKEKLLKKMIIGKTSLMLVSAEDAIQCSLSLAKRKIFFYNIK